MKDFKDSTKVQYMKGGSCEGYAKGGKVKGAAKINKVMSEFKRGELHSGSKEGPKVTSKKQATAIALSEARKAGAKIPQPVQKKSLGGILKAVSPVAALASGDPNSFMGGMSTLGLVSKLLQKKKSGQPLTPAEQQQVAAAPQQAKRGGPIKKNTGGVIPKESTSARPKDKQGRPITDKQLREPQMTPAQIKAAKEAVARGNRAPREPIPTDAEAARMMSPYKKGGGVGSFNSKPLVGKGGLSAMPHGKKR